MRVSPLYAAHVALGAKMVPFGGWEMPLAYRSGTVAEHRACRADAWPSTSATWARYVSRDRTRSSISSSR